MRNVSANQQAPSNVARPSEFSQSIDWYSDGESRIVEVDDVRIEIRYVGRKARRARISITAPLGSLFIERLKSD